jgi:hypothetical protein
MIDPISSVGVHHTPYREWREKIGFFGNLCSRLRYVRVRVRARMNDENRYQHVQLFGYERRYFTNYG